MALLFVITVLALTGTVVDSSSNVTGCDAPLSNSTCKQGSCLKPPCMMHCGLTTLYGLCTQTCNSSCDSVKCTASQYCLQTCSTANCTSMTCDAPKCVQQCESATCGVMKCVKNAKRPNECLQSSKSGQMICENEICFQNCSNGNCNLTCSSSAKQCDQTCDGGNCQYKCEALLCSLSCKGGTCTNMLPSTTKMPPTTTSFPTTTTTSSGYCLQMTVAVSLALMFALVAFM